METLQLHVQEHSPQFIFLSETKLSKAAAERLRVKLGYDGCLAVDRVGLSEGLALFWKDDVEFNVGSFSRFHIEVKIT